MRSRNFQNRHRLMPDIEQLLLRHLPRIAPDTVTIGSELSSQL